MSDETYIERAISLAERGRGLVSPNPMVGAVVVTSDGRVAGEGWHEGPGTPHAEIRALEQAGERARGAVLFTSLEPCDHFGRTGPCTDAIVTVPPANHGRSIASIRSRRMSRHPIPVGKPNIL